ncbi:MAG TPA: hypothetical protein VM285_00730, partial [Polyangia bacterium]|nr:hypothetical protein [Polyangia bacterium]
MRDSLTVLVWLAALAPACNGQPGADQRRSPDGGAVVAVATADASAGSTADGGGGAATGPADAGGDVEETVEISAEAAEHEVGVVRPPVLHKIWPEVPRPGFPVPAA